MTPKKPKERAPKRLYAVEVYAENVRDGTIHDPVSDGKVLILTSAEWRNLSKALKKLSTYPEPDHEDI